MDTPGKEQYKRGKGTKDKSAYTRKKASASDASGAYKTKQQGTSVKKMVKRVRSRLAGQPNNALNGVD